MLTLIDTHCHLEMAEFDSDRLRVLGRAKKANVRLMITIGSSHEGSLRCVELAGEHEEVFATMGVHPFEAERWYSGSEGAKRWREHLDTWSTILKDQPRIVGIGECGLDRSRELVDMRAQRSVFEDQLLFAKENALPVVLHIRDAHKEAMEVLRRHSDIRAVVHCFTGTLDDAKRYVEEFGYRVSFTGIVTFGDRKIGELLDVVRWLPSERMMIETDAPYIAPVPYRGARNEPAYVVEVAKAIARLRNESPEEVAEYTTANAKSFFSLPLLSLE